MGHCLLPVFRAPCHENSDTLCRVPCPTATILEAKYSLELSIRFDILNIKDVKLSLKTWVWHWDTGS